MPEKKAGDPELLKSRLQELKKQGAEVQERDREKGRLKNNLRLSVG